MADDEENDDQWLYGDNPDLPVIEPTPGVENDLKENEEELTPEETAQLEPVGNGSEPPPPGQEEHLEESLPDPPPAEENGGNEEGEIEKQNGEGSEKDAEEDEDSDDDVNIVIGDFKTSPAYTSMNIKRGGLLTAAAGDKVKQTQQQPGKFPIDEFEHGGMINGVPAAEFNLDSLEDKPWRKPGADITDYFNYGFNEDTWRAYCERQKRMRINESGVGLAPLNAIGMPRGQVPIMNDNSKYSGNITGIRKAGPPPGRRMTGAIDVIGGPTQKFGAPLGKMELPKENIIQVMTADRREYSRKPPGFPDMSMPPPGAFEEFQPEYGFNPEPEPFYGGYEPTQDSQWGPENPPWQPQDIKSLTTGAPMLPSAIPPVLGPPMDPMGMAIGTPPLKDESPMRRRSRDRDASRSRSEKPRDRDRERSHRRERSRSRSRRHRSRSRSPSHRSHRKKKSKRHEDSE